MSIIWTFSGNNNSPFLRYFAEMWRDPVIGISTMIKLLVTWFGDKGDDCNEAEPLNPSFFHQGSVQNCPSLLLSITICFVQQWQLLGLTEAMQVCATAPDAFVKWSERECWLIPARACIQTTRSQHSAPVELFQAATKNNKATPWNTLHSVILLPSTITNNEATQSNTLHFGRLVLD